MYAYIEDKIEEWIEEAILIRWNYQGRSKCPS